MPTSFLELFVSFKSQFFSKFKKSMIIWVTKDQNHRNPPYIFLAYLNMFLKCRYMSYDWRSFQKCVRHKIMWAKLFFGWTFKIICILDLNMQNDMELIRQEISWIFYADEILLKIWNQFSHDYVPSLKISYHNYQKQFHH